MKSDSVFTVKENIALTNNVFKMTFSGTERAVLKPGQFVNIQIPNLYLRRPISAFDMADTDFTIVYKVVGEGTEILSKATGGDKYNVLCGLGNGYSLNGERPLLIGGGCGVAPLYLLAKKLIEYGSNPRVIMGFNSADEIFCEKDYKELGVETLITTIDGSYGVKGFVTEAMKELDYDYIYSCGPLPMLKSVFDNAKSDGEYSFEERMGCGFGACMGCSIKTKNGYKRICTEGPVLKNDEIIWEEMMK